MVRGVLAVSLGALVALGNVDARADPVAAEALFREARALLEAGDVAGACDKFEASSAMDPSSGSLLNLAACRLKQGRTATAWAYFVAAERTARTQNRPTHEKEAHQRVLELEPILSYVTIEVAEPVPGLQVVRNGVSVEPKSFGLRVPVDPGPLVIEARARGFRTERLDVTIGESRDEQVVRVPKLQLRSETSREKAPMLIAKPDASRVSDERPSASPWPWLVGGVGAAALLTGGAFGLLALASDAEADRHCEGRTTGCNDATIEAAERRDTQALVATIGIGGGLAGLGVATVLLLSNSTDDERARSAWGARASVNARGAQFSLTTRF